MQEIDKFNVLMKLMNKYNRASQYRNIPWHLVCYFLVNNDVKITIDDYRRFNGSTYNTVRRWFRILGKEKFIICARDLDSWDEKWHLNEDYVNNQ